MYGGGTAGVLNVLTLAITLNVASLDAFILPGLGAKSYVPGEPVELRIDSLTSVRTHVPYAYNILPYCTPTNLTERAISLGEILGGRSISNSPYVLRMLENMTCHELCKKQLFQRRKDAFKGFINDAYQLNFLVDDLPGTLRLTKDISQNGFPVGQVQRGKYYINNHVSLYLKYHKESTDFKDMRTVFRSGFQTSSADALKNAGDDEGYRIVGFEVKPKNVDHGSGLTPDCSGSRVDVDQRKAVRFTYDVIWLESTITWATRWDMYLGSQEEGSVRWFSILNSLLIVAFLTAMVAVILLRTLRRDIARYNALVEMEGEENEESGWKLVHGDAFRKPRHSTMLAAFVGSGVQLLAMCLVTVILACFGFLHPAYRGAALNVAAVLFTLLGFVAGYASAWVTRVFGGHQMARAAIFATREEQDSQKAKISASQRNVTLIATVCCPGAAGNSSSSVCDGPCSQFTAWRCSAVRCSVY
eukprot:gnl/MRDRNA2_/MRDRNA2_35047_c0_seq1.p1 gnl/MRDRNA2_/MRDRNA2_35047_c0~~gnl/MRDRNA2_/MRDRNA2_35047_c0_seq1.p1  ORF type:complete len:473 (+),score=67.46 gnl/MRDRNA2_/MRDRNA2_35047_c0_seq1:61-1479(+)